MFLSLLTLEVKYHVEDTPSHIVLLTTSINFIAFLLHTRTGAF